MKTPPEISRRDFFKISLAGAGLAIGFSSAGCTDQGARKHETAGFSPSAYLKITPDNQVTILVTEAEMGQGVWTSLPMLIAEELDIDLAVVQVEQAPLLPEFRYNITWGSESIRKSWVPLRMAGAIAREMLVTAAAGIWLVPASECAASNGFVVHEQTGRTSSYGDLAVAAADLPIPDKVTLKNSEAFRHIGVPRPMLDTPDKSMGTAVFGMDVRLDGMLTATVVHCPVFGGSLKQLDSTEALAVPGVRHVLHIDTGVAVVADNFWAAKKGSDALKLQWEPGPHAEISSATIEVDYARAIKNHAEMLQQQGQAVGRVEQTRQG